MSGPHPLPKLNFSQVLRPTEKAYTLPPACYVDEEILAFEQEHLFAEGWVSAGRVKDLTHPGDYLAFSVANTPLIATRGDDDRLRVFANTCRHRGMRLVEAGRGQCRQFVCPFHAWCYRLDGSLSAAPRMEGADGFDLADFSLVEVRSEERAGFLFVNVDAKAPTLDDWLGDFEQVHEPWRLGSLVTASRRDFTVDCNWKLFIEVFNEYYHLRKVHPHSFATLYTNPDPVDETRGAFVTQFGEHARSGSVGVLEEAGSDLNALPGLSGRLEDGTRYTWVYPGLTFAASRDAVWVLEAAPVSVSTTAVRLSLLFDSSSTSMSDFGKILERYEHRMKVGMDEDIFVLEAQQLGLNSRLARAGRVCPELEPSVHVFHRWYADQLIEAGIGTS
tara:strand:+ start:690 stop:1856 length:1167 start_codon:yes stop_codon:yes gene_type:complete